MVKSPGCFPEDPGLITSVHMGPHNSLSSPFPDNPMSFLASVYTRSTLVYRRTLRQNTNTWNKVIRRKRVWCPQIKNCLHNYSEVLKISFDVHPEEFSLILILNKIFEF